MSIFAKVFDIAISEDEVKRESRKLIGADSSEELTIKQALNRLIDECVLFHVAQEKGFEASESEFDTALFESLEEMDNSETNAPLNTRQAQQLEGLIRRRIIVGKYIQSLWDKRLNIGEDELNAFYEDQKEVFYAPETVRASHILIKKESKTALKRITKLRESIKSPEDFQKLCSHSECPTNMRCGDLGFFARGKMIKEIEDVAFSLEVNQISDIFSSPFGYHILLLTDRTEQHPVPSEDIRESLKNRLMRLEREFFLIRHNSDLREKYGDSIEILIDDLKGA
ncbi:MAG: peptidylprolyl isomerase [Candidatus Cloacimonadaceae bacterium]|nr:peptidylprolyl isomerase [Candidatus Cloacimonadaceae bacterium]